MTFARIRGTALALPIVTLFLLLAAAWPGLSAQNITLPSTPGSVKFAAFGDNGTGEKPQYDIAALLTRTHATFAFTHVIMLGDNVYGGQSPEDMINKFSRPYKGLLDAGVKFYASLGNHDDPAHVNYPLWNMGGQRYYTYAMSNVRFFALDSNKVDQKELVWLENGLKTATEAWKICYFHHPLYSDGGTHGPAVEVRTLFEPLFVTYGVNVVFAGHEHFYERLTPQKDIVYFIEGAGGQLRKGDLHPSATTAKGFDRDQSFMIVEIAGDLLSYQAISRAGATIDAGMIQRQVRR